MTVGDNLKIGGVSIDERRPFPSGKR